VSKKKRQSSSSSNQNNLYVNVNEYSYSQPQYPVAAPDVLNVDDIAIMAEEEIYERIDSLEGDRGKVLEARYDATPWEVEIAWLRRELHVRRIRRDMHDSYLQANARFLAEEGYEYPDYEEFKYNSNKPKNVVLN
jgi:hypothetical protein